MIIGIVGKSGSGKNYISEELSEKTGHSHFDLDLYGHKIVDDNIYHICELFKKETGLTTFNRGNLSKIVFKSEKAMKVLNDFIHPLITEKVLEDITENSLLNGAVLHKSGLLKKCDYVIYVKSPLWKRIYRLYKRDNKSLVHILRRIYSQRNISPKLYEKCLVVNN